MRKLLLVFLTILIASMLIAAPAVNRATLSEIRDNREFDWADQNSGFPNASTGINSMIAVDTNIVWAAGYDGSGSTIPYQIVTHTTDGGTNWTATQIDTAPTDGDVAMIMAIDANKAWVPIHTGTPQGIYYTEDGGANWVHQESATFNYVNPQSQLVSFPNVVHFFNENDGFAQGDPVEGYFELYTTNNGGTIWTRVAEANIPAPLTEEWGIVGYYDAVGDNIWFGTQKGRVFYSNDKGLTWGVAQTPLGTNDMYTDVTFKDALHGLAQDKSASSTGTVCETSNGGVTWQAVTHTGTCYTNDMDYVPGTENTYVSTGAATGISGASFSYDGGHNWITFDETDAVQFLATSWINVTTGWAGCFNDQNNPGLFGVYAYTGDLTPQPMGTISGVVSDLDTGTLLVNAIITLGTNTTTTDFDGEFEMLVDVGTFDFTCELLGFDTYSEDDVVIEENQITSIDIALQNQYVPPTNLSCSVTGENVFIEWSAPETEADVTNYNIYRNAEILYTVSGSTTVTIDEGVSSGTYTYNISAIYYDVYESELTDDFVVEVVDAGNILPVNGTKLIGNIPNPFNPTTAISFSLDKAGFVNIDIYNVKGEKVRTLVNENLEASTHNVIWDGEDDQGKTISSGIYFYKMRTGSFTATKKMILMK
ncbi:MAG: carboxypeptidase regulatory-like domain-containing protein [Candidatus Tenebribacter davisii]|nr:carboxypeptidase regulatory-like domain-containing protein [Candidatus Tenebribacter davisii]